jgi:uncharacterized protein
VSREREYRNIIALLISVPVPSLGVIAGMILWPGTWYGNMGFILSKFWFFGIPIIWFVWVERKTALRKICSRIGSLPGLISGFVLSGAIVLVFYSFSGDLIHRDLLIHKIHQIGLGSPVFFVIGALYWIFINSLLEEYTWRWFCFEKINSFLPVTASVICSAFFFTLHHTIALWTFLPPVTALICSMGVFSGGIVWSFHYTRYRSIWPGWISHSLVDACIYIIAGSIIFT